MSAADVKRRGRPPKFGRSARVVAFTLPDDVLNWLHSLHPDPARAIVQLYDQGRPGRSRLAERPACAEIVMLPGGRGLILVDPDRLGHLPGVALIPFTVNRAFLALESGKGMADLELAVLDRLDEPTLDDAERRALSEFRQYLRELRRDRARRFESRSIIVVERGRGRSRRPRK